MILFINYIRQPYSEPILILSCWWWGALDTTLCDKVCQWLSPGTLVSSTNKTYLQDITPPPFKMMTITKNLNFINCLLLLFIIMKIWAQILTADIWQLLVPHIFCVFLWSKGMPIIHIGHIVMQRITFKSSLLKLKLYWIKWNQTWLGWSHFKLCLITLASIQDGSQY